MPACRSFDEAWPLFRAYACIEPALQPLWELCRRAAPPVRQSEDVDDAFNLDPFEIDLAAADKADDGWCAEDFFQEHVKPKLVLLVGAHRAGEPRQLHSREAYDTIYDLLLNWALIRPCACCATRDDNEREERWQRGDDGSPAYP